MDDLKTTNEDIEQIFGRLDLKEIEALSIYDLTKNILISIGIGIVTVLLIFYYVCSKVTKGEKVLPVLQSGPTKPRFRKRDKIAFYGSKMLRRVRSFAAKNQISVTGAKRTAIKKKQLVLKIARKILEFKKDQEPTLRAREPPPALLEADYPENDFSDHRLPPEVMYLLSSVRVLGHFEKPIFLELCRYMETRHIKAGEHVFKRGEMDESIWVVQSGKVKVNINTDGNEYTVKEVRAGDSIHSLLSILDVLSGYAAPYKTVSAIAEEDSIVLRLPAKSFQIVMDRYPESLVRIVQIIMVRLQRVTFMALHNYLGLSYELMNQEFQSEDLLSVHSINPAYKGSPMRCTSFDSKALRSDSLVSDTEAPRHRSVTLEAETMSRTLPGEETNSNTGSSGGDRARRSRHHSGPMARGLKVKPERQSSLGPCRGINPLVRDSATSGQSSSTSGQSSTTSGQPSDFDVACSRARVISDHDGGIMGSPTYKESFMEDANTSPTKKANKVVVSDHVQIIHDRYPIPTSRSSHTKPHRSDAEILALAKQDIVKIFALNDASLLEGRCSLRRIKGNSTLMKQGDIDAYLYFVVTGQLQVFQSVVGKAAEEALLFPVFPGELVGGLAVLTGEPSFFTIRSLVETRAVVISKGDFYAIMKEQPQIVLNLGHNVVKRMSGFVRQIDFALDWMQVDAGRALFKQGERSDCTYIVLNGRMRSVVTRVSGKKEIVGEYGRGELVGIVEALTQTERATTMIAIRDTEVAVIPDELLNLIKRKYPQIVTQLIHLLGQRILGSLKGRPGMIPSIASGANVEGKAAVENLNTIAVLPITDDCPISNFTSELQHALLAVGPTLKLTRDFVQSKLGSGALDNVNEYRLSSWLGQQEDIHRMVLYQCDYSMTKWTQRCVRQADCILLVAPYQHQPQVSKVETQMEHLAVRAQKELILLHREDGERPRNTVGWLNLRGWVNSHYHVKCPKRVFSKRAPSKMNEIYTKLFETEPDRMSDFSRLARVLTGTAIGLVLGGGGARGLSHVGVIRAMTECGVPIDFVGGTSIGSFMGGLWAEERNVTRFTQRAREWSLDFSKLWKKIIDLTYPVTAMFTGGSFNRSIHNVFEETQIEDLWIPYFNITTDITSSRMRVHTSGILWKYVRASMSLSGYLPPLCDPCDGHLLLDGGYVNNVPADVMKTMNGVQIVFAVDVGAQDDTDYTHYGDELSGWWLLWKRWVPWTKPVKVPNMAEIQSRLAYVSCNRQLEQVKETDYCEYIRPPIDKYGTLQFGSFDEIHECGYHHGKALFTMWRDKGLLVELFKEKTHERANTILHKTDVPREAKFTDLAELISRIDEPRKSYSTNRFYISEGEYESTDSSEDDMMSVTSEPAVGTQSLPSSPQPSRGRAVSEGATPYMSPSPGNTPTDVFEPAIEMAVRKRKERRCSAPDATTSMLETIVHDSEDNDTGDEMEYDLLIS